SCWWFGDCYGKPRNRTVRRDKECGDSRKAGRVTCLQAWEAKTLLGFGLLVAFAFVRCHWCFLVIAFAFLFGRGFFPAAFACFLSFGLLLLTLTLRLIGSIGCGSQEHRS